MPHIEVRQLNQQIMVYYKGYIEKVQNIINELLQNYISSKNCKESGEIADAMSYSLLNGGKRIRPALCVGAAEAIGESSNEDIFSLACAIEMIHTYSLIHDDLPAMDNDFLRRGNLTCHKQFSEATAILAGDALLTFAFEILAKIGIENNSLSKKIMLEIIQELSIAAGFKGMIRGQMKDINSEGVLLSKRELQEMHVLKTGRIIEASVSCGAMMACANRQQLDNLKSYAFNLGLAFQVTDDILNVVGNPMKLGKAVGTDLARAKNTYPNIFGLNASKKLARLFIDNALYALKALDHRANPLRNIAQYVLERNM